MATTVDKAKVNQSGTDIISNAANMRQSLNRISDLINQSKEGFDSEASAALRSKFNASAEKFPEFESFIKSYGEFLQNFAGNIQSFESAVQDAASQIPDI